MTPEKFEQVNAEIGPPDGMEESQVRTIHAHVRKVIGGNLDGSTQVIVAWKPSEEDINAINAGGLIYLSCLGGLPPHFLSTEFEGTKL